MPDIPKPVYWIIVDVLGLGNAYSEFLIKPRTDNLENSSEVLVKIISQQMDELAACQSSHSP